MKRLPATAVVFLLALGLYAATTHRRVFIAGNDASRWAAIESIVDYGSASVERSRFAANIDRVRRLVLRDRAKRHWRNYNGGRWGRGRGNAPDRS